MRNLYSGTRHVSRLFSWMSLLLGTLLLCYNVSYAQAPVRTGAPDKYAAPVQKSCSVQRDSRAVNLTLKGRMPSDVRVNATPVQRTAPQGKQLKGAYDINITHGAHQWQPQDGQPVMVSIADPAFAEGELLDVYHEGHNGPEFVATVAAHNGAITFPAFSFSVYIVTETGSDARLKVIFHQNETDEVTIFVKAADTLAAHINTVVYDPGVGTLGSGVQFRGWTTKASYTSDDIATGMTIEGVRNDLKARFRTSVTDGTEVHYYAMLFKSYVVTYLDERNATLGSHDVTFRLTDPTTQSYKVNMGYSPQDNEHNFMGWQAQTGGTNISGWTSGTIYPNETDITISGDVVFGVEAPEGHWLVFDENGRGATYIAPQFVLSGDTTTEPSLTMVRNGYTFDGWWTGAPASTGDDPTGTRFTFGGQLSDYTTIYAKWNPKTSANYSVIIWKQSLECDTCYDFERVITLSGTVGNTVSTVHQQSSGNSAYAQINGTNYQYTGFHLDRFDQNVTIKTEGNSLVNVYYDRTEYTLTFRRSSSGTVYKTITAKYQQYIGNNFPITTNGAQQGWRWDPQTNSVGFDEVLVYIDIMPAGNVTFHRSEGSYSTKYMAFYVEALPGQTAERTWNGKSFVKRGNTISANYNFFTEDVDFPDLVGYTQYGSDPAFNSSGEAYVSNGGTLYLYYTRNVYKINFMDGQYVGGNGAVGDNLNYASQGQLEEVSGITYGASVASYNAHQPATIPTGFVFEGWYVDQTCTQPYTFTTMPSSNITVYAKWRQKRYRVFLHPMAGTDPTLDWGSASQAMNFGIAHGGKLSAPYGRRSGYEFVGWYSDQAYTHNFNADAFVLNDNNVPETPAYDKTVDMTDDMDKWGNIINPSTAYNSDASRPWVQRKLDLYAKWRATVDGATGISVIYDATPGSNAPTDLHLYQDNTNAVAGAASTEPNDTCVFSHWVVQKWNGTAYVNTSVNVYPGAQFAVLKDNAKIMVYKWTKMDGTDTVTSTDPTSTTPPDTIHKKAAVATYTIQLKAVYVPKEKPTPTFIVWYNNYAGADKDTLRQDGKINDTDPHADLHINEAVTIPTPAARPGFTFKGWYKKRWLEGQTVTPVLNPAECDPNFLYYNNTDNNYYKHDNYDTVATQVAADELNPYDYLYAVWQPDTIIFATKNDTLCFGATPDIPALLPTTSDNGIAGTWNSTTVNTNTAATTEYTFTPTTGQCADALTFKKKITVLNPTVTKISGLDTICAGNSTTLSVPDVAGNTYHWSTDATTASITVSPESTTNYAVTVTSGGCKSNGDTTVVVNAKPVVNSITVPAANTCPGAGSFNVTGNVTGGKTPYQYTWTGATGITATASVTEDATNKCNKTYNVSLKVTDANGCESSPVNNSFTVKDDEAPAIQGISLDSMLVSTNCTFKVPDFRDTVRAISSDNCTAKADLDVTQSPAPDSVLTNYGGTQTVTVKVTDACGKSTQKVIKVTVPAEPIVDVIGADHVCYDSTLVLTALGTGTTPLQYNWNDVAHTVGATLTLSNMTTPGKDTVEVTVTDANGCTATRKYGYVVYEQLQGGSILYEKIVCNTTDTVVKITGTTPASGGGSGTYSWQTSTDELTWNTVPDANTQDYTIKNIAHTYVRRVWNSECDTVCTNVVYVAYAGNVDVGTMSGDGTASYCYGSSVNHTMMASGVSLLSGAAYGFVWYTSTDTGKTWSRIDTATHQSFTYTNPNFTVSTSIYFKYAVAIENCDTIFANEQVQLDVIPLPTVTVTPNATQIINLGDAIENVTVNYANGTLDLTGMPAGVTSTSTTISGRPSASGTYIVKASVTNTCGTAIDSFKIIVNDTLALDTLVFDPTPICVLTSETNSDITITEAAGNTTDYTYAWDVGTDGTIVSGGGTQSIVAKWSSSGTKHVTVEVKNKLTGAASYKDAYVVVNKVPTITIDNIADVCPNTNFDVKGNVTGETAAPYIYTWSSTSTGLTVTPATANVTATSYTSTAMATGCGGDTKNIKLTVKDNNNCQVSTDKNVTVTAPSAPTLTSPWPSDQSDVNACYAGRPAFPTKEEVKALYTASCGMTLKVDSVETVVSSDNCNWEIRCKYTITDSCNTVDHTIIYKGGDKTKPTIGTGYDTELPAILAATCQYSYPDFTASVKGVSTDNCTADTALVVTQSPAAGTSITVTSLPQTLPVKVYVEDLCGNKDSVAVNVTVPAALALTIDTSASNCFNTADGFLNYTITNGVAGYTVALTGPTSDNATQTAAGSYSFNNLADGSYTLTVTDAKGCEATATTTIQQINTTLSITANSHSWTFDGSAHSDNGFTVTFGSESHTGTSGTDVSLTNGDVITGVNVTGTITNVTESPVDNALGTGIKVMRGTRDVTCFYNIDTTFGKLTVTSSSALTLACKDTFKTYDSKPLSYEATPSVTTGTTVYYSADTMHTWSTTVPSITNVSESPLRVYVKAENDNYTTATCDYLLTVNCKQVTIKANGNSREYNGNPLTETGFTASPLETGDTHTFTVAMTSNSTITEVGDTLNEIATVDGIAVTTGVETAVGNYCVTTDTSLLVIVPAGSVIPYVWVLLDCPTGGDTTRKYNGDPLAPVVKAYSTLVPTDTFDITYSLDGGSTWSSTPASVTHVDEGTKNVKVRATNPNYTVTDCDFTMHVTCRNITMTSGDSTKTYDGSALKKTVVVESGDDYLVGESPLLYDNFAEITNVGTTQNTFTYTYPSDVHPKDYCVDTVYGTLTVTKAPADSIKLVCPSGTDIEKMYDGTALNPVATATGIGTDVIKVEYSLDSIAWVDVQPELTHVGTQFVYVRGTNPNYDTATCNYTLKINCRDVALKSGDSTRAYNATVLKKEVVTVSGTGWLSGKEATYDNFAEITNVGSVKNSFTYTLAAGEVATDYCVTVDTGTLTVTKAPADSIKLVCPSGTDIEKMYDGTALNPVATATGIGTDVIKVEYSLDSIAWVDVQPELTHVGTQFVYVRGTNPNYDTATCNYTLKINCRDVALKSGDSTRAYNATVLKKEVVTVSGTGWLSGKEATYDNFAEITNVGSVKNSFTYTLAAGEVATDYCVTVDTGTLTVTKAPADSIKLVCPSGSSVEKKYDGTALSPVATATGIGTDVINVEYSTDGALWGTTAPSITHVSTQLVYVRGTNPNYDTATCDYTLKITCRMDTLLSNAATKVYDSTPLENTTITVKGDGFVSGEEPTYSNFASIINVGKVVNTFDYAFPTSVNPADYCITVLYDTLEITCKEVTIKSNGAGKTYDALPLTESGFTATALEATDPHTFVVAMSAASTITNVGKQPNIIETVDGVAVTLGSGNVVGNYCVTIEADTLEVVCMPVTITAQSKTKEFDGTPLTWDGFDATALATTDPHVFTVKMTAASTITNAGSTPNVIDSVDGVHVEPGVSTAVGNYCVTAQNGTLKITPRPLLILDTLSNKMYDGDTLRVEYSEPEVEAIGLVTGDFLTAGQLSTDNYIAGYYRYEYTAPLSTAVMSEGNALISSPFATDKGISNYTVSYKVKLTITPRPLEITAASDSKVYDCVDLEKDAYSITGGALATTDHIDTVFVTGLQHCVGSSANVPSGAIILHGVDTVTGSYNITYVNGLLEILPITTGFVCPADLDITLWHSTCDTNVTLPAEATLATPLPAGCVSITNNLVNPLPAGVHTITWSLKDECGNLMTTCDQTITVNYAKCDTAVDYDGNKYPSERIGCNCWTVPNLKSEHYSDGTDIANYTRYDDKDSLENIYGKLYSWYSAARVAEDDNTAVPADSTSHSGPYVEGVCPAGWALPTVAEYLEMFAASGSDAGLVKSPSTEVWLPGKQGTAPNKFNAYGAGYYDGSIHRYLNLLAETHFWAADNANGSATAKNFVLNYYCSEGLVEDGLKGLGYSIRCIQKK